MVFGVPRGALEGSRGSQGVPREPVKGFWGALKGFWGSWGST